MRLHMQDAEYVSSMRMMADDRGFPDIAKTSPWSLQIFRAKSTSDSAWVAPIRRAAMDTYTRLNRAVAEYVHSILAIRHTGGTVGVPVSYVPQSCFCPP